MNLSRRIAGVCLAGLGLLSLLTTGARAQRYVNVVNQRFATVSSGPQSALFVDVAAGKQVGGGPLESLYRIVTQMNQVSPLPEHFGTHLIQSIDAVLKLAMIALAYVLPDFGSFSTVGYVAYGYNIPMNHLNQDLLVCLAYLLGLFIFGYFFLRTREVAK